MNKFGLCVFVAAISALVGACSMTLGVRGTMEDGDETFTGTATGYLDHSGTLQVTSSKGTVCMGEFVYITSRQGQGTFNCSDHRSGPFEFVSTGTHGTGNGRLGGQRFTFTFG
jgi:hypothetical protein